MYRITQILNDVGLAPEFLEIEVTESTFMDREANAIPVLNDISDLGIRLAVDDFGTGYSSLSYLKQLPVQVLKIDQSFVRGLTSDEDDATIVTAIAAMAKSLNLTVTAEGVETVEPGAFEGASMRQISGIFIQQAIAGRRIRQAVAHVAIPIGIGAVRATSPLVTISCNPPLPA